MVVIRLARGGRKKFPFYSIVVANQRDPRDGRFIEKIGYYAPTGKDEGFTLNLALYEQWLSKGAQPSKRVASLYKIEKNKQNVAA